MKNVMKWMLLACLTVGSTAAMGQVKLGFINSGELFQLMPERQEAYTKLEAYSADLTEQLEQIQVEFNSKLQDYQKNSSTYNDTQRSMKETELQSISSRLQESQQIAENDFAKMQETLLNPVIEKMNNAIQKVAKDNGMTTVFDLAAGALIYHDTSAMTDLLPLVKQELGIN